MAGKFNKNIKYKKKFFNIYKDKKKIIKHRIKPLLQITKPKFKDLTDSQKQKYLVEKNIDSMFTDIFDFMRGEKK